MSQYKETVIAELQASEFVQQSVTLTRVISDQGMNFKLATRIAGCPGEISEEVQSELEAKERFAAKARALLALPPSGK